MIIFDDFLKTGHLGDIRVGSPLGEIVDRLGEPHASSGRGNQQELLKYGALQLAFSEAPDEPQPVLSLITIRFDDPVEELPPSVVFGGWMPTSETTIPEFRDHLESEKIPVGGGVASGPDGYLVLDSSVTITFSEGRLYSVSCAAKPVSKVKQISITLPNDAVESIRREAKAQGLSVSALCSRWLKDHAASLHHTRP